MSLIKRTDCIVTRIINVSSAAYEAGRMNWEDLNAEKKSYSAFRSYANSKLANVLHAKELARRGKEAGIVAFSVHPGKSQLSHTAFTGCSDTILKY